MRCLRVSIAENRREVRVERVETKQLRRWMHSGINFIYPEIPVNIEEFTFDSSDVMPAEYNSAQCPVYVFQCRIVGVL